LSLLPLPPLPRAGGALGGGGGASGVVGPLELQWPGRRCRGGALAAGAASTAAVLGNAAPLGGVGAPPAPPAPPVASEDRGRALRPRRRQQPHSGAAVDRVLDVALGGLLHVRRPDVADVAPPHSRHVLAPRGSPPEG